MSATPARRAYTGSCACEAIRFIVYLTLPASPPDPSSAKARAQGTQRLYRCNCTFCHKAGIMHIRLPNPGQDFQLLSPLDPLNELGDFTRGQRRIHFLFCKTCGVRCFSFMGEGEVEEVEDEDGERREVWHPRKDWVEGHGKGDLYLSVNAHTVDAGQEGFDMREWKDKKWLCYLDYLGSSGMPKRSASPQPGGCY